MLDNLPVCSVQVTVIKKPLFSFLFSLYIFIAIFNQSFIFFLSFFFILLYLALLLVQDQFKVLRQQENKSIADNPLSIDTQVYNVIPLFLCAMHRGGLEEGQASSAARHSS